tara:strand:+ start:1579 stop:2238 length:660 start_codon:yes stop_codon:yes gene_type:complete
MLAFDIETMGLDASKHAVTVVCAECLFTGQRDSFEFARLAAKRRAVMSADMDDGEREADLLILEEEHDVLLQRMVDLFDNAPSLCAFNGVRFDLPFLMQAFDIPGPKVAAWVLKMTDILEASRLLHKHTFKLDLLCEHNGMPMKSGSGLQAIEMAREQRFDALRDYCADDVAILCNLYRQRFLQNPRTNKRMDLADWAHEDVYDTLFAMEVAEMDWEAD